MDHLLSLNKKKKVLKSQGIKYDPVALKEYYDNDELNQIYKKPIYNKKKAMQIYAPPHSFQIDIIFLPKFKYANSHYDKYKLKLKLQVKKLMLTH